ncbi:CsbD family protein [Nocardiopsis sp. HNM0947]|uniref:CsbD family protein n=1 Tax=Nocardiopsis coralli TaxID=2772213 RepID=A0ABR9PF09_9ACTN|nr:CsbD family protein [Nocardiopsis coralli]MBE3002402.1 CsbD family protein [Nocardiopsis coralli]
MSQEDKSQGKAEQAKGKLKEMAGKVTGNDKLKSEGQAEQFKGRTREGVENAKDTVRGTFEGLRGDDDKNDEDEGKKDGGDDRA